MLAKGAHFAEPRVRGWRDEHERALLSMWISDVLPVKSVGIATWISLHRVGGNAHRFQMRERRWLILLHEQCAAGLRSSS